MYSGRGGGGFGGSEGPKPVRVGDELDVAIEAVASRGDGIAKKDGFVIFVRGAPMGQTVRIRITDVRERYSVGQLIAAAGETAPAAEEPPAGETAPAAEEPPAGDAPES